MKIKVYPNHPEQVPRFMEYEEILSVLAPGLAEAIPELFVPPELEAAINEKTINVSIKGDTFAGEADKAGNWVIDFGGTGFSLADNGIEVKSGIEVELTVEGDEKPGTIRLIALPAALYSGRAASEVSEIEIAAIGEGGE